MVDRTADDAVADIFQYRNGLACHERFIDRAVSLNHLPVNRDFITGTDYHDISFFDLRAWNCYFFAFAQNHGLRRNEIEQGAERVRSSAPRLHFHPVAEQHESNKQSRGLVKRLAADSEREKYAEEIGRQHASRDKNGHVQFSAL